MTRTSNRNEPLPELVKKEVVQENKYYKLIQEVKECPSTLNMGDIVEEIEAADNVERIWDIVRYVFSPQQLKNEKDIEYSTARAFNCAIKELEFLIKSKVPLRTMDGTFNHLDKPYYSIWIFQKS